MKTWIARRERLAKKLSTNVTRPVQTARKTASCHNEFEKAVNHKQLILYFFLPRDARSAKRGIAIVSRPSVRPSVRNVDVP